MNTPIEWGIPFRIGMKGDAHLFEYHFANQLVAMSEFIEEVSDYAQRVLRFFLSQGVLAASNFYEWVKGMFLLKSKLTGINLEIQNFSFYLFCIHQQPSPAPVPPIIVNHHHYHFAGNQILIS